MNDSKLKSLIFLCQISNLSVNDFQTVVKWKDNNVVKRLLEETSTLAKAEFRTTGLLEYYAARFHPRIYLLFFVRSNNGEIVCPLKTRINQVAPNDDEKGLIILDGTHGDPIKGWYGKAIFSIDKDYDQQQNPYGITGQQHPQGISGQQQQYQQPFWTVTG